MWMVNGAGGGYEAAAGVFRFTRWAKGQKNRAHRPVSQSVLSIFLRRSSLRPARLVPRVSLELPRVVGVFDDLSGRGFGVSEIMKHQLRLPSCRSDLPVSLHSGCARSQGAHAPEPLDIGVLNLDQGHDVLASTSHYSRPRGRRPLPRRARREIFVERKPSPVKPGLAAPEGRFAGVDWGGPCAWRAHGRRAARRRAAAKLCRSI